MSNDLVKNVRVRTHRWEKSKHTKSVCMFSLRLRSLLKKVSPGISPRLLSRKIEASEPKKICLQLSGMQQDALQMLIDDPKSM